MKVVVVGGTGLIGSAVARALEWDGQEVVRVGCRNGDVTVDLGLPGSVEALYNHVGEVDAVVCAAGVAVFGSIDDLSDEDYAASIRNKLMGQVNLVRRGLGRVTEGGSFTLTSGTLSAEPDNATVAVAMTGAAVEGFVRAAALDLEGRYRLNAVSPAWVAESRQAARVDPEPGIRADELARYYVRCVTGQDNGRVFIAEKPLDE